jgi:hypothetical protein
VTTGAPSPYHIRTFSGRFINPLEPEPKQIALEDIVHALGNLCRFTGHSSVFYSVAEHSVCVSRAAAEYLRACGADQRLMRFGAILGLLHDAPEAYIGDIAHPLKCNANFLHQEELRWTEDYLQRLVLLKFAPDYQALSSSGLQAAFGAVHAADKKLVFDWEYHLFMGGERPAVEIPLLPVGLAPADARKLFLDEFSSNA